MTSLTNQMLSKEGLSLKWAETILSIIRKISAVVRPDVRHENDDMDIRQYVQIKKVKSIILKHVKTSLNCINVKKVHTIP